MNGVGGLPMRGTPSGEKLSIASLVSILGAGILETLGVAMVLGYGKKSGNNGLSFSKMWLLLR